MPVVNRHYGLDVKVMTVGSKDVLATFESFDLSDDATVKESTSAQDSGPNKRVVGSDFTISLNKFISGSSDFLFAYLKANRNDVDLVFTMTVPGSGNGQNGTLGTPFRTITMTGCVCTKLGMNVGGDATKESYEFGRGAGGEYTIDSYA